MFHHGHNHGHVAEFCSQALSAPEGLAGSKPLLTQLVSLVTSGPQAMVEPTQVACEHNKETVTQDFPRVLEALARNWEQIWSIFFYCTAASLQRCSAFPALSPGLGIRKAY